MLPVDEATYLRPEYGDWQPFAQLQHEAIGMLIKDFDEVIKAKITERGVDVNNEEQVKKRCEIVTDPKIDPELRMLVVDGEIACSWYERFSYSDGKIKYGV